MTILTVYELTKFLNIKGKTRQETHTHKITFTRKELRRTFLNMQKIFVKHLFKLYRQKFSR